MGTKFILQRMRHDAGDALCPTTAATSSTRESNARRKLCEFKCFCVFALSAQCSLSFNSARPAPSCISPRNRFSYMHNLIHFKLEFRRRAHGARSPLSSFFSTRSSFIHQFVSLFSLPRRCARSGSGPRARGSRFSASNGALLLTKYFRHIYLPAVSVAALSAPGHKRRAPLRSSRSSFPSSFFVCPADRGAERGSEA